MLVLKKYDNPLIEFKIEKEDTEYICTYFKLVDTNKNDLPLDLDLTPEGIIQWLKSRIIPKNRAYVENFLAKIGVNRRNLLKLLEISKSLSLNDSYWIVDRNNTESFKDVNLYENKLNNTLSVIAFTGFGSYKGDLSSSPEYTTHGMLAKAWRRLDGKTYLFKSGSSGFANSGKEPYSEFFASQVAQKMGLNAVYYDLSKWKKKLCSVCELFSDMDTSFIPIGKIVTSGGMKAIINYYKNLGDIFYEELIDMLVFDAVIVNVDRHFGNFGLLIDNKTNKIIKPAPIFDNGFSLFYNALDNDIENIDEFYKGQLPKGYDDFIEYVKPHIKTRHHNKLKKLINFSFEQHKTYKFPRKRLKVIENFINKQVNQLLTHP